MEETHIAWSLPDVDTSIITLLAGTVYNKTAQEIADDETNDFYLVNDADNDPCLAHENVWGTMLPNCVIGGIATPKTSFAPPTPPFKPW